MGQGPGADPRLALAINGQPVSLPSEPLLQSAEAGQSPEQSQSAGGSPAGSPAAFYRFHIPDLPEGMVTLAVTASAASPEANDPFPANNSAYTTLQVFPPPRVLLVTGRGESDAVTRFGQALDGERIQLDWIPPENLPTNLAALQQYRVIFLDSLLATQLTREQMTAVQLFSSRLAGGVVFLGGRSSYTLGGYEDTPLEAILPVRLEPPPRTQRPPMAFQLVLDRSSSMNVGGDEQGFAPIDLAREAAMRAIETMQVEDTLGVLTFSTDSTWDFPLSPLGSQEGLQQALAAVSQVYADGSTGMYQAMQEAVVAMINLPADAPINRTILLLSDGQSTDGSLDEFVMLSEAAQAQGITISTIALGEDVDEVVLQRIAEAGKGRFYAVPRARDLPRILVAESRAARSENIQQGETSLETVEAGHPLLSGLDPAQLPILRGYNALRSRSEEGAEDILVSTSFRDPVLSAWQVGLGRVAAWTGDLGEEWTDWSAADAASPGGAAGSVGGSQGAFWAQVVRYMLVDPAQSPAQATVQIEPTRLRVDAAIYTSAGEPVNLAEVKFTFADAAGQNTTYRLIQQSAGRYQAEIPRPPDGAYRAVLSYPGEDGNIIEVPAPFAVNPPAEWQPQDPASGAANLQAWAALAGGQTVTMNGLQDSEQSRAPAQSLPFADTWWWLLLALVILWPLEIAIRRRWLPWRG